MKRLDRRTDATLAVTVPTDHGFDPHSIKLLISYFNFFALESKQSAALRTATQRAMLPDCGGK